MDQIICERMRIVREGLGINKSEAADILNLSKMGYHRYETGERTPSYQTLTFIAQKFNTSVAYLTGETEDAHADQIVLDEKNDGELFALVEFYKETDSENRERILSDYRKLAQKT